jgi:undecaprenyl-diphosphatase
MQQLNESLFLLLNAGPGASALSVTLAIVAARYLILCVPFLLVGLWLWGDARHRSIALSGLIALLIAISINQLLGAVAFSPRPFMIGLGRALIEHRPSSSFPSNHATVCLTIASVLFMNAHPRLAWCFVGIGLVVAWSRVFLGIHFPADMLGAAAVAVPSAILASWIVKRQGDTLLSRAEWLYRVVFAIPIRRAWVRA